MRITDNTVLITGGSAGIGLATAKAFVAAGNTVVVCGRDTARLESAKKALPGLHTIRCDLTRDDELVGLAERVRSDFPELNILINNAAVMHIYDFLAGADVPERIEEELHTNLLAPMKLTSLLLPLLQQQPSAAIVLVSSGLAYVPVANLAVYCATKAALHSFARSLRRQLRQTAIKVFELLPPTVNTDMTRTLRGPKLTAEQVAKELLSGIEHERYELRVGMVKPLRMISRLAPLLTERMLNKALSN